MNKLLYLCVSTKKISDTNCYGIKTRKDGKILEDQQEATMAIKSSPKQALYNIAYFVAVESAKLLSERKNIDLAPYKLFGGQAKNFKQNFLSNTNSSVDFYIDKYDNPLPDVFENEINYEGKKMYFGIDSTEIGKRWSPAIAKLIEDDIESAIEEGALSSWEELKNIEYVCLSNKTMNLIMRFLYGKLSAMFEEFEYVKDLMQRNQVFKNLRVINYTEQTVKKENTLQA